VPVRVDGDALELESVIEVVLQMCFQVPFGLVPIRGFWYERVERVRQFHWLARLHVFPGVFLCPFVVGFHLSIVCRCDVGCVERADSS
jgi:hypothetical protein